MTPRRTVPELLTKVDIGGDHTRLATAESWVLDELNDAWHAAREEASIAYVDWTELGTGESYVVYRAAQDRADAAQDAVAAWDRVRNGGLDRHHTTRPDAIDDSACWSLCGRSLPLA
jgi:hypothetical protein